MSRLERAGLGVEVPPGWEGSISGGDFRLQSDGSHAPNLLHVASFPMPSQRGTFGAGAVESMSTGDVFVALVEYGPESADTPLFAQQGIPRPLHPRQFDRNMLQHNLPGQSGLQQFFTYRGRAFCLYVVLGSHLDRAELVPLVNAVLDTLTID